MRLFDFLLVSLITAALLVVLVVFHNDAMPYPVAIPVEATAATAQRPWAGIWVHSSGAPKGGLMSIDRAHAASGGAPFHFVIGNGTETADGLVEEGPRWKLQQFGRNKDVIEICLVGAMDREKPTRKQQASLEGLLTRLCRERLIPPTEIFGESEKKRGVACPGRFYDAQGTRRNVAQLLAR